MKLPRHKAAQYVDFYVHILQKHHETLFLEIDSPDFITVASGSNFLIVFIVPEKLLPPCVTNGIIVFPEKSYSSKNE